MSLPTPKCFDDFVLLGDAVNHHRSCKCGECKESLQELETLGNDRLNFAQRLYWMCKRGERSDVLFRAQMEDWNEEQLRKALEKP